jgi:hypothetical protein
LVLQRGRSAGRRLATCHDATAKNAPQFLQILCKRKGRWQKFSNEIPLHVSVPQTTETAGPNMQRYFFHIMAGDLGFIPDAEGKLLSDLEAAHLRAVRIMFATMAAADEVSEDWRVWKLKVTDGTLAARSPVRSGCHAGLKGRMPPAVVPHAR